jgi:hypothetical protein
MGKDVLWEIHSRRAMASSLQLSLPNVLPAHVISRCLAFWFLVYSQSTLLLLSMFRVCVRDVAGVNCYFQGWNIMLLLFALLKLLESTATKMKHTYLNEEQYKPRITSTGCVMFLRNVRIYRRHYTVWQPRSQPGILHPKKPRLNNYTIQFTSLVNCCQLYPQFCVTTKHVCHSESNKVRKYLETKW